MRTLPPACMHFLPNAYIHAYIPAYIHLCRKAVLSHFNTSESDYIVVFTSGCTQSCKLVGESFAWQPGMYRTRPIACPSFTLYMSMCLCIYIYIYIYICMYRCMCIWLHTAKQTGGRVLHGSQVYIMRAHTTLCVGLSVYVCVLYLRVYACVCMCIHCTNMNMPPYSNYTNNLVDISIFAHTRA
jgi:hypothetical protein